jgi:hypothetical protein
VFCAKQRTQTERSRLSVRLFEAEHEHDVRQFVRDALQLSGAFSAHKYLKKEKRKSKAKQQ